MSDDVRAVTVGAAADYIPSVARRAFNATANSAGHERFLWKGPCFESTAVLVEASPVTLANFRASTFQPHDESGLR
jgi:hypothetical protein